MFLCSRNVIHFRLIATTKRSVSLSLILAMAFDCQNNRLENSSHPMYDVWAYLYNHYKGKNVLPFQLFLRVVEVLAMEKA